jgi:branched-chain amino acid transport system substrate-binding protein
MKTRRSLLRGLAALGVAASLSLPAQAADPVRIGFAIAKTGPFAIASDPQLKAYELWKEQVNARGGLNVAGTKRPVEFVMYDDQSKPDQAVRLYEKLITSDKVDLLIAPWGTPFHIAIAPVLEKYKFPVVGATAASVRLRELKPGYIWFTTSAIPDKLATELAALCVDNKVKTVSIINNVLPFTKEIRTFLDPKLQEKGIVIKTSAEYPPDTKDMTAMLTQIKQANPDAVLALSYPPDSVLYAKQARELGISAPIQFVAIGPTEAFFAQVMGKATEGIITIGHWMPRDEWRGSKAFYDAYKQKYNEPPDYLDSALAYMSLEVLEQAVAKAGLDREKIRQTVASDTFETINGKVRFEGVQNVITPTAFLQFQNGTLQLVWPPSFASAKVRPKKGWD